MRLTCVAVVTAPSCSALNVCQKLPQFYMFIPNSVHAGAQDSCCFSRSLLLCHGSVLRDGFFDTAALIRFAAGCHEAGSYRQIGFHVPLDHCLMLLTPTAARHPIVLLSPHQLHHSKKQLVMLSQASWCLHCSHQTPAVAHRKFRLYQKKSVCN